MKPLTHDSYVTEAIPMIGKLVKHKFDGRVGVVVQSPEKALGFPYVLDGEIQAYFPATTEDILEGTVEVDVRKYEVAHVKVQWENADKPVWVKIDNLEIIHLDT